MSEPGIHYGDWREGWSTCTAEDLETLAPADVQRLIDTCEANHSYHWVKALKKLYDKRHEFRQAAMETLRQDLGQVVPEEQLLHLIRNPLIPIEHYPIELVRYMTSQWLETLTIEEKTRFMERLSQTRLRVWKRCLTEQ